MYVAASLALCTVRVSVRTYLEIFHTAQENWNSIAQFSVKDADAFVQYEKFLGMYVHSHVRYMCL